MFKRDLIRLAVEAFDLRDYVIGKGGESTQKDQMVLTCPTCGKKKLAVHLERKAWHCWICEQYGFYDQQSRKRQIVQGAGGLLDLVQFLEGWPREKAAEYLIETTGVKPADISSMPFSLGRAERSREPMMNPPEISLPEFARTIDGELPYMVQRRISMEDVRAFGIFHCVAGRYAGRMIFPVFEEGKLVYFQGRAMFPATEGVPYVKALNPPRQEGAAVSSDVLLNLDVARKFPRVAICEGPIDAVHAGPSAVATFGKKISQTQIAKLLRAGVRAVDLLWDGPSASEPLGARPEMERAAELMRGLFDVRLVLLSSGDPGDWPREALNRFRARAFPVRKRGVL